MGTATGTKKTQAFPTISAIWASGVGFVWVFWEPVLGHNSDTGNLFLIFILFFVYVALDGSTAPISGHGFVFGLEP
jgi:hypothetical protein